MASWRSCCWRLGLASALGMGGAIADRHGVLAQVTPDNTLGTESSVVNQINQLNQRIDGGAIRGANLFHSFFEFNVGEGQGVYFTNPTGIDNILSRVTGNNPALIFGRLGVLGDANLFLLNPNGILFGQNASLDIKGSFVATTADGIALGDRGFFSATEPQQSRLLAVSPGALFFTQLNSPQKRIVNAGNLAVGKDFTLAAGNLDLQGQLSAGNDLNLQALNQILIKDSSINPFRASAGGQLLVQGNQGVGIFALNHPNSGLFSGGNLVLRSANPVIGGSHFYSGDNFRIEQLNGALGGLLSPNAPVIRASGDVAFDFYQGASLHILAGGSINIPGYVWIQGSDPVNGIAEEVTLSDGTKVAINGRSESTLDIRAGTTAFGTSFINTGTPTSADINIGTIFFQDAFSNPLSGTVLLTNQYQPNPSLSGNIQVSAIQNSGFGGGGLVALDSKGSITANGTIQVSAFSTVLPPAFPNYQGNGGDVTFLANGDITFNPGSPIVSNGLLGGDINLKSQGNIAFDMAGISSQNFTFLSGFKGGDINIIGKSLSLNNSAFGTDTFGKANAGNINIQVLDNVALNHSLVRSSVFIGAEGQGGDIRITAGSLSLENDAQLITGTAGRAGANGRADAGNIFVDVQDTLTVSGNSKIITDTFAQGNAGDITLQAGGAISFEKSTVSSGVSFDPQLGLVGAGRGGDITITAQSLSLTNGTALISSTFGRAEGDLRSDAGNIQINVADRLLVSGGSNLRSETGGQGDAGNITINAGGDVSFADVVFKNDSSSPSGISSLVGSLGEGKGGEIKIVARSLSLTNGAEINSTTRGRAGISGRGDAGNIIVNVKDALTVNSGGQFRSDTFGEGNAGSITIDAPDAIVSFDGGLFTNEGFRPTGIATLVQPVLGVVGDRRGGDITVKARSLFLANGAQFGASTFGKGNAGNIKVEVSGNAIFDNFSSIQSNVESGGVGNAGTIEFSADSLSLTRSSQISTLVRQASLDRNGNLIPAGQGNGGNITIEARNITFDGITFDRFGNFFSSGVLSNVAPGAIGIAGNINIQATDSFVMRNGAVVASDLVFNATGRGGDITIKAGSFSLQNRSNLVARTMGQGDAGNININVDRELNAIDSDITTSSEQTSGGAINITAQDIRLRGDSDIRTNVANGTGGGGNITLNADSIIAFDDSDILAFARDGRGGDITLNTPAFFGDDFRPDSTTADPNTLDGNDRVDVNASGAVFGVITAPDVSFIQNSLADLPENPIDTENLIANSCVVRSRKQAGTFVITGAGGLPVRPGDAAASSYPTGTVRTVPDDRSSSPPATRSWQLGDPIVEPQGSYRLPNGELILSRECSFR